MVTVHDAQLFLARQGFDERCFREKQTVTMPEGSFKISLLYTPVKKREGKLPYSNQKKELLTAVQEIVCYIEAGQLLHNAKRLAYMMCSGIFIWATNKEEFESVNKWFFIAFQRSLTEFVFAEEKIGKDTIYFFKGCPDITMRERL